MGKKPKPNPATPKLQPGTLETNLVEDLKEFRAGLIQMVKECDGLVRKREAEEDWERALCYWLELRDLFGPMLGRAASVFGQTTAGRLRNAALTQMIFDPVVAEACVTVTPPLEALAGLINLLADQEEKMDHAELEKEIEAEPSE